MSFENVHTHSGAMSPPSEVDDVFHNKQDEVNTKPALTPPTSEDLKNGRDDSGSELSDLEPEENIKVENMEDEPLGQDEEILPDHYYDGGKIPVFKPTMRQFRSFKDFVTKIDKYGMKSGIVKVIPPQEWRDSLPALDDAVKTIRVRNPITQEFHGIHGTYTQANMEKQRSYNLPQWKSLCDESNHQPPAKRGERRRNLDKPASVRLNRSKAEPKVDVKSESKADSSSVNDMSQKRGPGRPRVRPASSSVRRAKSEESESAQSTTQTPPTPKSPPPRTSSRAKSGKKEKAIPPPKATKQARGTKTSKATKADKAQISEEASSRGRQPKSVSSRRLNNQRDQVDYVDEKAFKDFDYRTHDQSEWTSERIQELETAYWRSLNFNNPMYGADMPGSLFDDSTKEWNVARLENLLDVLGQAVPGVNTAYLYLGMWKATFAWHLEDVDLYSINYIHFGAPKQWYSISQEDARRFENAMKTIWPTDAKNCDQFLRHKTYLISPHLLQTQFNIKVNRLVHYEGEFVITFPYGYHSGYNIGYNCAESVNFATETWLDYGKVAKKCNCEADNVWVDVREIERKLRGEPTPEYYEETDDDDDEEEEELDAGLPTPPGSVKGKKRGPKRKRPANEKDSKPRKKLKIRIRAKAPAFEPCILCPNDNKHEELLPTDNGQRAHRICGLYTPETYVSDETNGTSMVRDIAFIDRARLELKCNYCRSKKGAVFQCSSKKCTKAYHATCAMAAGIQIDIGPTSVYGEDGTEYVDTGYDFRCRIHRSKRSKNADSWTLESNDFIHSKSKKLSYGDAVQAQFYQGDIFAGNVIENRKSEQIVLLETMPLGHKVEVEWKWLLFFDPVNSQLPIPSENAKPLPADMLRKSRTSAEDPAAKVDGAPKPNDPFHDPNAIQKWSEFESLRPFTNPEQRSVDIFKLEQLWHYLGELSTDAKQYYSHDPKIRVHNAKSNFLDLEKAKLIADSMRKANQQKTFVTAPGTINQNAINAARAINPYAATSQAKAAATKERPYHGKYAITDPVPLSRRANFSGNVDQQSLQLQRAFQQQGSMDALGRAQKPNYYPYDNYHPAIAPSSQGYHHASNAPTAAMSAIAGPPNHHDTFSFNAAELLKKLTNHTQVPPPLHHSNHPRPYSASTSQQSGPRPLAPVANMMGSSSVPMKSERDIKSSPLTNVVTASQTTTPTLAQHAESPNGSKSHTPPQLRKGTSSLNIDIKYHYLHNAEAERPTVYRSPYAPGSGFTDALHPPPFSVNKHRRAPSISDAFLMTRSPSERGTVTAQMIEEKARFKEKQQIGVHRSNSMGTQQAQFQRPSFQQHQVRHSQPSHLPMSAFQNPPVTHGHPSSPSYFDPGRVSSPSYSQYQSGTYQSPSYQSPIYRPPGQFNQHHYHYPTVETTNAHNSYKPQSPMNFQSPHDFQDSLRRESRKSPAHEATFDRFSQQLKEAASHQPPYATQWGNVDENRPNSHSSYGHGQTHAGSPLRNEFGHGQSPIMLPAMGDDGVVGMTRRA